MPDWKPPTSGALDDTTWPETLVAKAIEPVGADDRMHGYSVLQDLARHYEYSDLLYLSIIGELPDKAPSVMFRVALCSLATPTVNEAPSHVGLLSRICGGALASSIAAATIALADQAKSIVQRHAELLHWLCHPSDSPPPSACDAADAEWVRTLFETLASTGVPTHMLHLGMSRDAARLSLLFEAGVQTAEHMQAAIVSARMSGVMAEILLATPRDLGLYPVKLPPFHYVEGES